MLERIGFIGILIGLIFVALTGIIAIVGAPELIVKAGCVMAMSSGGIGGLGLLIHVLIETVI